MAVRLARSEAFGHLSCGNCSEAVRDQMRCPLKLTGTDGQGNQRRPPRAPSAVPAYTVNMGPSKRAELFTVCPQGSALTDDVARWLSTFGVLSRFNKWPPGRDDPRFLEAADVIQRELDTISAENAKATATK